MPLICPRPGPRPHQDDPDCPLYDRRIAVIGPNGALRRAILMERGNFTSLAVLIQVEAVQPRSVDRPPQPPPVLPAPRPSPPTPLTNLEKEYRS